MYKIISSMFSPLLERLLRETKGIFWFSLGSGIVAIVKMHEQPWKILYLCSF
jgi:hypothetical protein